MEKHYKKINSSSSTQYSYRNIGRLADIRSTVSDGKEETEKLKRNNMVLTINSKLVTIDEDEKECLRRLAETTRTTVSDGKEETEKMKKNNKVLTINSKLVTIDEDEKECLRRLAENKNDQPLVGFNQKLKLKNDDDNKSLESKKSLDINESAEKFIQNFKQQLLLQRLQSIENVDNIIARGL